jgi:hypothetical protein
MVLEYVGRITRKIADYTITGLFTLGIVTAVFFIAGSKNNGSGCASRKITPSVTITATYTPTPREFSMAYETLTLKTEGIRTPTPKIENYLEAGIIYAKN